jgi:hypothetical protein
MYLMFSVLLSCLPQVSDLRPMSQEEESLGFSADRRQTPCSQSCMTLAQGSHPPRSSRPRRGEGNVNGMIWTYELFKFRL